MCQKILRYISGTQVADFPLYSIKVYFVSKEKKHTKKVFFVVELIINKNLYSDYG